MMAFISFICTLYICFYSSNLVRFLGLQEAYTTSVLLLERTFGLGGRLDASDFAKERHSNPEEELLCKGYTRRGLIHDPRVCRAVMAANHFDVRLYEAIHREICRRLRQHGDLWANPAVQAELEESKLCGAFDWSNPNEVCAVFETDEWVARRKKDRETCIRHHAGMVRFG